MAKILVKKLFYKNTSKGFLSSDDKPKLILQNINASFESKKINVIMGAANSGKTTLLNIIHGMCDSNVLTSGTILIDGKERDCKEWLKNVSYSMNQPFIDQKLKLCEYINFVRNLKRDIKDEYLNFLVENLQLDEFLKYKFKDLPSSKKKAAELLIDLLFERKILLLDELTSNLDQNTAFRLVLFIKKLAEKNDLMVIMTAQQASENIFNLFDKVIFLYKGMQMFECATTEIPQFLKNNGMEVLNNWAVPDFLLEIFSDLCSSHEIDKIRANAEKFISEIKSSLKSEKVEYKRGSSSVLGTGFNFDEVCVLFKADIRKSFLSISFFLKMIFISISYCLIRLSLHRSFFPFFMMSKARLVSNFAIVSNICISLITKPIIFKENYQNQQKNEIKKGFYDSTSVFLSSFFIEICQLLVIYIFVPLVGHFVMANDLEILIVLLAFVLFSIASSIMLYFVESVFLMLNSCSVIMETVSGYLKSLRSHSYMILPILYMISPKNKAYGIFSSLISGALGLICPVNLFYCRCLMYSDKIFLFMSNLQQKIGFYMFTFASVVLLILLFFGGIVSFKRSNSSHFRFRLSKK